MKTLVALVGTRWRGPDMVALLASLPNGEPLTLIRESTNAVDRNAIQVWARGAHVGYVKGSQNRDLAATMDRIRVDSGEAIALPAKLSIKEHKYQPMIEID